MRHRWLIALMALTLIIGGISAQESPEPVMVELIAEDDVALSGAYYASTVSDGSAVLLLHQLYATRTSWTPLIQPLLDAGYHVLAVDVRGYGSSKARINWVQAVTDSRQWAEWLAGQAGVQRVYVMGSSMGSALALNACDAYESCKGAVAISAGLAYYGLSVSEALAADFPKLLVYADRDRYPALLAPHVAELENPAIEQQVFVGRTHGMDLFTQYPDLLTQVIGWMSEHE